MQVLACGSWQQQTPGLDFKRVNGGLLVQEYNVGMVDLQLVTERQSTDTEMRDALFCWKVAKFVKSNAIVYAREQHIPASSTSPRAAHHWYRCRVAG